MPLNLLITAEVLSCVMQRCGRMDRKSPARSGRDGPSAMCDCAIFSTMVCPISNLYCLVILSTNFAKRNSCGVEGPLFPEQISVLVPRQLILQIHHLANVMMQVRGTLE